MVQWLRVLAALAEEPVWFPALTLGSSQPPVTPAARDAVPASGLPEK